MLYLKAANFEDSDKEFEAIKKIPFYENGYINKYCFMDKQTFKTAGIQNMLDSARGFNLAEGDVPESYYFLWKDNVIVGLFKIRHYLNDELREGSGHIGFGILKEYRGNHYGTEGLRMTLELCRKIVKEDEVYMACYRNNMPSLRVMLNNGAKIVRFDDEIYYTKVKIR